MNNNNNNNNNNDNSNSSQELVDAQSHRLKRIRRLNLMLRRLAVQERNLNDNGDFNDMSDEEENAFLEGVDREREPLRVSEALEALSVLRRTPKEEIVEELHRLQRESTIYRSQKETTKGERMKNNGSY